jgi:hypothetical protein
MIKRGEWDLDGPEEKIYSAEFDVSFVSPFGTISSSENRFSQDARTLGRVVYSMSRSLKRCGMKGPCRRR